jgi:hypothetical protein
MGRNIHAPSILTMTARRLSMVANNISTTSGQPNMASGTVKLIEVRLNS